MIKTILKESAIVFLKSREKITKGSTHYVFILAHMRSGSTLLNHILMSHSDILGCGESNAYYNSDKDLEMLRLRAYYRNKQFFRTYPYMVDQINHNKFIENSDILNHPKIRVIFLIREPGASVSSMVRVLGQFYGTTLDEAVAYYEARIKRLSQYAQDLKDKKRATIITYADLVENTNPTLLNLSKFLGLTSPLSEHYKTFEFTGKSGDPGPNIQFGQVKQNKIVHQLEIPPKTLNRLEKTYTECFQIIKDELGLNVKKDNALQ